MGARHFSAVALAASCSLGVLGQTVQLPGLKVPSRYAVNKTAVVTLFNTSYTAYKEYALGHDDLSPVSLGFSDPFNGWGASMVDALDTMYIMGLTDLFEEAVNYTTGVDFSKSNTDDDVDVFETTIRYVGGFLSAYELSGAKYPSLVEKAEQVAAGMAYAWTGNNSIPYNEVDFSTNTPSIGTSNIAQAGTLTMEFGTLSKHTGNQTYRELAEKAVQGIIALPDPLPGMAAQGIDPSTGESIGSYVTWGGGSDSYFEYLIKYPRLTNTNDSSYVNTWKTAVDTSIKTLLRTSTVGNHLYLADFDGENIRHVGSHLACFYGGNWLLGGKILGNQTIVDYGLQLTDACWNTYASTLTGIGPESFAYISSDGNYTGNGAPTPQQLAFYKKHGFYISTGGTDYILRPEVLESNFYAWRVSGKTKYLDNAVAAIASFNKYLPATVAFSGISDVTSADSPKYDDMASFWFAEVLKYLYLTFDDPSHVSLDEWVFNTECHPLQAPPPKSSYQPTEAYKASPEPFKVQSGSTPAISPNTILPVPMKTILNIP